MTKRKLMELIGAPVKTMRGETLCPLIMKDYKILVDTFPVTNKDWDYVHVRVEGYDADGIHVSYNVLMETLYNAGSIRRRLLSASALYAFNGKVFVEDAFGECKVLQHTRIRESGYGFDTCARKYQVSAHVFNGVKFERKAMLKCNDCDHRRR